MPPKILTQPDTTQAPTGTSAVPAQGWVQGALDEVGRAEQKPVTFDAASFWENAWKEALAERGAAYEESLKRQRDAYERGRKLEVELAEIRAEAVAACTSRKLPVDYIRGVAGEGYIYVIAFTTGTVKVGQTEAPKQRLNTHQGEALAYGVGAIGYWISPPHRNFKTNEAELIRLCHEVSRRSRREYFHEVGFEQAVDLAWSLTFDSVVPNQSAVACGLS